MRTGPVIIGFDGTPIAQLALAEAVPLVSSRDALIVTVWEAGRVFDLTEPPLLAVDNPVASLDLRATVEVDYAAHEAALRIARHGVALATDAGMKATGLAVADEISVADTLVRLAEERDATAVVLGAHRHGLLSEVLLGSTTRDVLDKASCPVVVVREQKR